MHNEDIATDKSSTETSFLFQVLVLSIALHFVIGYLIFQRHSEPKQVEAIKVLPIQATLIFAPIQQPEPEPEPTQELDIEQLSEPVREVKDISAPKVEETLPVENAAPEIDTRRADLPPISAPTVSEKGIATRDLAKHHLKEFTQNADNALAQREAERFRQQKNSPNIALPQTDPYATNQEKFKKDLAVRVNCSTGLNKSLAVLSNMTGGNLDCSEAQSITPYIEKHLKKKLDVNEN